jgi:hypothetical protein
VPGVGAAAGSCDRRPGTERHEAELGEELHLREEQMLRGELVAASLVPRIAAAMNRRLEGSPLAAVGATTEVRAAD